MRLLVVGAAGQVGGALLRAARSRGDTSLGGYVSRRPDLPEDVVARIDKTDATSFGPALDRLRPDWVVDAGALHNVDYCEGNPTQAFAVNRDGTAALARAAVERGIGFVFVSTDFVFDGAGSPPYVETESARPLSVYGRSKLEGEQAVLAAGTSTVVVRTSVVYSWVPLAQRAASASKKPVNFGSWVVDELVAGRGLRIVEDQVASPTLADDLAGAILGLIDLRAHGTFHAAGATPVSRYAFSVELAKALGLDARQILATSTDALHQLARRPLNSSLDSSKLRRTCGYAMLSLPEALARFAIARQESQRDS
jgi:dTDP-4-dehydrorhamnose reductase